MSREHTWALIPEFAVQLAVDGVLLLHAWQQEQENDRDEEDDSQLQDGSKIYDKETSKLVVNLYLM